MANLTINPTNKNIKSKESIVRISKRVDVSPKRKALMVVLSVICALIIGGIFILCLGYNPIKFYVHVFTGNFVNKVYLMLLLRAFVPLLITSLGIAVAFKMRFWNIGAEGQFLAGASISMTFALLIGDNMSSALGIPIVLLMGALGGGLYALIPALLKVRFGTNETLLTLMLNYVAQYAVKYFLKIDFFREQAPGIPTFKIISKNLWLPEIGSIGFKIDIGIIVGIIILIFLFLYFKFTKHGYEISVVGDSPNTAKYAGMKFNWIIIRTMFISGAVIGLGAGLVLTGTSAGHTLGTGITGGVGWDGIIVAWLAKLNPLGIAVTSFLMAILEKGCSVARTNMGISAAVADIIQSVILFSVLAFDFFINYKITFRKNKNDKHNTGITITAANKGGNV